MYVRIAKVGEALFEGEALSLSVPGTEGDMTILPHHSTLVSALRAGTVRVTTKDDTHAFEIQKGLVEVSENEVIVLV